MKTRSLTQDEMDGLQYYRTWINDVLNRGMNIEYQLNGTEQDLEFLNIVLSHGPYSENPADELSIIGGALGEVIAGKLNMEWTVYSDEKSSNIALIHKHKQVLSFPQDMLLKRAQKGELTTVSDVYQAVVTRIRAELDRAADREIATN